MGEICDPMLIGSRGDVWSGADQRSAPYPNPRKSLNSSDIPRRCLGGCGPEGWSLTSDPSWGAQGFVKRVVFHRSVAWKQSGRSGVDLGETVSCIEAGAEGPMGSAVVRPAWPRQARMREGIRGGRH